MFQRTSFLKNILPDSVEYIPALETFSSHSEKENRLGIYMKELVSD